MRKNPKRSNALYVHLPFCAHLCHYCDFAKLLYNGQLADAYVKALLDELESYHIGQVATIYLGGGTPTALSEQQLETVLAAVGPHLAANGEFTVECNVENATLGKLSLLKRYGVNRLSIGVESFHDEVLKAMNRKHTAAEAAEAVQSAKSLGFANINVDLMYGLPDTDIATVKEDIEGILKLDVDHISAYALSVAPNTVFYSRKVLEPAQETARAEYDLILSTLRQAGYRRYEVSNFARNGKLSAHNLVYWNDDEYYGIGLGASGYLDGVRYTNTRNMSKYLAGQYADEKETISPAIAEEDYLMLKLRLDEGFAKEDFAERFGFRYDDKYGEETKRLAEKGLLIDSPASLRCTDEGIMLLDYVLLHLFKE